MKKTIVINFVGGPGAGKSYMAMRVASNLKERAVSCEYVPEFAKDLVYEGRKEELGDQLYVLAMQNHMLKRVKDKVDVIVTDCPIILSMYYNEANGSAYKPSIFNELILDTYKNYDNIVYYVNRNHPYVREGRYQTEEESIDACNEIKDRLDKSGIKYEDIVCSGDMAEKITDQICLLLSVRDSSVETKPEYERKFLLKDDKILKYAYTKVTILQNYFNFGERERRIRCVEGNGYKKYYYAEKHGEGSTRSEYEIPITREKYLKLHDTFTYGKDILKDRYFVELDGTKSCEINYFHSPKKFKLIEVEFENSKQMEEFSPPKWFGQEVTQDKEYYNSNIAK